MPWICFFDPSPGRQLGTWHFALVGKSTGSAGNCELMLSSKTIGTGCANCFIHLWVRRAQRTVAWCLCLSYLCQCPVPKKSEGWKFERHRCSISWHCALWTPYFLFFVDVVFWWLSPFFSGGAAHTVPAKRCQFLTSLERDSNMKCWWMWVTTCNNNIQQ